MERFSGLCPGTTERLIEKTILNGEPPVLTDDVNGIKCYRVRLPNDQTCVVLARDVPLYLITVMTIPAMVRLNARSFIIRKNSIEKVKHVKLSDNQRRGESGECQTHIGFLRDATGMHDSTAETPSRSETYRGHLGTSLRRRRNYQRTINGRNI